MRRAGLSRSRLNQAKSLYVPFFKWARNRGLMSFNPMADFELPTSKYVSTERTPPEVEELCLLLHEAVAIIPEVAALLVLGAVTGMRRGELVGLRRSRVRWTESRITVDSAVDGQRVKNTKTRKERSFHVDEGTIVMLARVCEQQDLLAAEASTSLVLDPFVFSLTADASRPMPPDYVTKRVGILMTPPNTSSGPNSSNGLQRSGASPIGDIAHNYRSALDHLAWQLALLTRVGTATSTSPTAAR